MVAYLKDDGIRQPQSSPTYKSATTLTQGSEKEWEPPILASAASVSSMSTDELSPLQLTQEPRRTVPTSQHTSPPLPRLRHATPPSVNPVAGWLGGRLRDQGVFPALISCWVLSVEKRWGRGSSHASCRTGYPRPFSIGSHQIMWNGPASWA